MCVWGGVAGMMGQEWGNRGTGGRKAESGGVEKEEPGADGQVMDRPGGERRRRKHQAAERMLKMLQKLMTQSRTS